MGHEDLDFHVGDSIGRISTSTKMNSIKASLVASNWDVLPIRRIWNSPNAMPLVKFQMLKPRMLEFCEIKELKVAF